MIVSKGDQGQKTCALDGCSQLSLIAGIGARNTSRNDLAGLGHKVTQGIDILVVNLLNAFCGKSADTFTLKQGRLCGTTGTLVLVKFFVESPFQLLQFELC